MKEELTKMLIEAKGKAELYYRKHDNSFFGCYENKYLNLFYAEMAKVREIETQLEQLT
jgi:hypothetical protein